MPPNGDARFRPRPVVVLAAADTQSGGGGGGSPPSHPALIELARALGRLAAEEDIAAIKAGNSGREPMRTPAQMERHIERLKEQIKALERNIRERNASTGPEINRLNRKCAALEVEKDKAEQRERCADHEARKWKALYEASATVLKSLGHDAPQFGGEQR